MIRPATHSDIPAMLEMGRRFFDASKYADVTAFDGDSFRAALESLLSSSEAVVLVTGDKPVGMAAAILYPHYFNVAHKTAQEMFWFVDEQHRGVGGELLDALIAGVKAKGARSLSMIALESLSPEIVGGMYQRRGFRPSERSYIRSLEAA